MVVAFSLHAGIWGDFDNFFFFWGGDQLAHPTPLFRARGQSTLVEGTEVTVDEGSVMTGVWAHFPDTDIRTSQSKTSFKQALKTHPFSTHYWSQGFRPVCYTCCRLSIPAWRYLSCLSPSPPPFFVVFDQCCWLLYCCWLPSGALLSLLLSCCMQCYCEALRAQTRRGALEVLFVIINISISIIIIIITIIISNRYFCA